MENLKFDINQFFRYLLGGGWALTCYFFITPNDFRKIPEGNGANLIILALIIGSVIYVAYRAIFYPFIYKLSYIIRWCFRGFKKKEWDWGFLWIFFPFIPLYVDIKNNFQRWSERQKKSFSSKHIVLWGSQVHLLFCCGLAGLFTIFLSKEFGDYVSQRGDFIFMLSWILIGAGIVNSVNLLSHDLKVKEMEEKFNEDANT